MMQPRVLFVASTASHILNFHQPYLAAFVQRGFQVDVACGKITADIPQVHKMIAIPFQKSMTSLDNIRATHQLRELILEGQYTLISCHTSLASFFTRLAVKGMRHRPLIVSTSHGYLFDDASSMKSRILLGGAEKLVRSDTDLLMTMNQWDDTYARSHQLGKQIVKIPGMGVDFSRFDCYDTKEQIFAQRRAMQLEQDAFVLIYAAEFSKRKNQSQLIRSMKQLPPNVVLILPGDGALKQACMDLARALDVDKRVIFPGHVSNMSLWYAVSDVVVSASRSEGLPFHIMEAMYCGLPAVASDVKGHSDLIENYQNGILFPFDDYTICADAILSLLEDRSLCASLGQAAKASVAKYDIHTVLPQVMAQYESLLPLQLSKQFGDEVQV